MKKIFPILFGLMLVSLLPSCQKEISDLNDNVNDTTNNDTTTQPASDTTLLLKVTYENNGAILNYVELKSTHINGLKKIIVKTTNYDGDSTAGYKLFNYNSNNQLVMIKDSFFYDSVEFDALNIEWVNNRPTYFTYDSTGFVNLRDTIHYSPNGANTVVTYKNGTVYPTLANNFNDGTYVTIDEKMTINNDWQMIARNYYDFRTTYIPDLQMDKILISKSDFTYSYDGFGDLVNMGLIWNSYGEYYAQLQDSLYSHIKRIGSYDLIRSQNENPVLYNIYLEVFGKEVMAIFGLRDPKFYGSLWYNPFDLTLSDIVIKRNTIKELSSISQWNNGIYNPGNSSANVVYAEFDNTYDTQNRLVQRKQLNAPNLGTLKFEYPQ